VTHFRSFAFISAFAMMTAPLHAHEFKAGDLTIDHPWTRATPANAPTAGGYAKITNHGTEPDRLTGGTIEGAKTFEVHEMSMDNNVMKMRQLETGLEIKPGETVELKPGSYHFMMIGLDKRFEEGTKIKGTLTFKKAGTVPVEFKVEKAGTKASHDHGEAHKGH
jgi:copper(I)-binding protein